MKVKRITPTCYIVVNDAGEVHRTQFRTKEKAFASIAKITAGLVAFDSIGIHIPNTLGKST